MTLAILPPQAQSGDEKSTGAVSYALVTKASIEVPAALGARGRGGHYYSVFYPLTSVLAAPLVPLGVGLGRLVGLSGYFTFMVLAEALGAVFFSCTVFGVALVGERLGAERRAAIVVALAYGFGTFAWIYGRTIFPDGLEGLLVLAAVALAIATPDSRRATIVLAALCGAAVLAKPTGVVLAPCLAGYLFSRRRIGTMAAVLAGAAAGVALFGAYNFARFGSPTDVGDRPGFGLTVLPKAVAGLLVSPGRGLVWYAPPVVVAVFAARRRYLSPEGLLVLSIALAFLLIYGSRPRDWYGGESYGPRYLLAVLPLLFAFACPALERSKRTLLVLAIAGLLVNAPLLVSSVRTYDIHAREQRLSWDRRLWSPTDSALLGSWSAALRQVDTARKTDVTQITRDASAPRPVGNEETNRVVMLWWWLLPAAGLPRVLGASASAALAVFALYWLKRAATAQSPPEPKRPRASQTRAAASIRGDSQQ